MTQDEHRLPKPLTGDAFRVPPPDNENLTLMSDSFPLTPAELVQWARRKKKRLSRKLAADPRLWNCSEHRRDWNAADGIEQVTLRQCFGVIKA
jgi:hypothetical protein